MGEPILKSCISNTILFLIVYILVVPVLLIILTPILILRIFANFSAKFHPNIGRLLSPISSHFAVDSIYENPTCSLLTVLTLEGQIEEKTFRSLFDYDKYPELKQSLSRWMGFYCWRNDLNFNLDNHLKYISTPVDYTEMLEMRKTIVKKPYLKDKPLWECIVYDNYTPQDPEVGINYMAIVFRFHHCLVDGYSFLKFMNSLSGSKATPLAHVAKPNYTKRNIFGEICFWTKLITLGPFHAIRTAIENKDVNRWKIPPEKLQRTINITEIRVELEDLKQIAKSRGVKTGALIFAAFTGAIRNTMINSGVEIPNKFGIICPFPLPSHPNHMTNKM